MTISLTRLARLILTVVYPLSVRFLGNDSTSKYLPNRICQVDLNFNPKQNLVKASALTRRLFLQVNNFLIYVTADGVLSHILATKSSKTLA